MQRYGVVRTFVASVALFTIASFLCGIAWSFESLIAFRVLQGAVSGPMIPGSQALLMSIFPASRRGMALAIWSMTTLIAPVMGPLLGGYISDNYSWPWIFLINLPIGLFAAFVCWGALAHNETPTRRMPVDGIGLAMLVVWVGALQIMLDTGKDEGWFDSSAIVLLAIVAAVGFVAFLIWELNEKHPIVDLSLFRGRNFAIGTVVTCIGYGVFFGNVVILPLWLQTQLGYTATWAGLVQAPAGLIAMLFSPFVGRNVNRYDARWFATIAFVMMAVTLYMRSLLNSQAAFGDFVLPMLVQGVSMAFFFVSVITHPARRHPAAARPVCDQHLEFPAHHGRRVLDVDRDHRVGEPGRPAPEPAGRSHEPVQSGDPAGDGRTARRGTHRRPDPGRADPRPRRAIVHDVVARLFLRDGGTGLAHRRARLADPPAARGERHRGWRRTDVGRRLARASLLGRILLGAPASAVFLFGRLANPRMPIREQQRRRVADARANDAEVHGGVEQAGIPAAPLGQDLLDELPEVHAGSLIAQSRCRGNRAVLPDL